eukprot:5239021-Pleurochrysis_carterae.AAC.2
MFSARARTFLCAAAQPLVADLSHDGPVFPSKREGASLQDALASQPPRRASSSSQSAFSFSASRQIGASGAKLRVADETHELVEGKAFAFDDSFEHEVRGEIRRMAIGGGEGRRAANRDWGAVMGVANKEASFCSTLSVHMPTSTS